MTKLSMILNAILVIALAGVLIFFLAGKGINIDKRSISTSISNSYASSGSFAVGYIGGDYRGNWKVAIKSFDRGDDVVNKVNDFMNQLNPLQFTLAKMVVTDSYVSVYYPEIATAEDKKTKKIVNGIEVKE